MSRSLLLAAWLLLVVAPAAYAADASEHFAAGERAFATGDFDAALRSFRAARDAGAAGPSVHYNIGVSLYRLRDYAAAETEFQRLASDFPALRELAEYNRGLALRADGRTAEAARAFERARAADDGTIAALAATALRELGVAPPAERRRFSGYFSGGAGYDDNVALVDELVFPSAESSSSPFLEAIGVLSRDFGATPLRLDASGYWVRYPDTDQFDQSAVRLALVADRRFGPWTLLGGPTLARSTLDGDRFEELVGADVRLRRALGEGFAIETRLIYDDADAGDARFDYLEGSRRQVRLAVAHSGTARVRAGYDVERNRRADPGVSARRQRVSVSYQRPLASGWTADAWVSQRDSRYGAAAVPREERLREVSVGARRALDVGWALGAEYRWSDNDSTVAAYSYDAQRVALSLSRTF